MWHFGLLKVVLRCTLLAALLAFAPASRSASDSGSPDFEVTVKQGDTLTGLAQQWLADPKRWAELQRHNKIENPDRLVPGNRLAIPASLLREKPAEVTVVSVSGRARKSDITLIAAGDRLREGETINTEENGYVTVQLVDGSTLRLQSRSNLNLERVRRLPGSDATETRIQLPSGQAEVKFNPGAAKASRFEIRTGFASAAVRGTEFRVGADARGTRSEVIEGTIAFAGLPPNAGPGQPADAVPISEGYGSIVDESRKPIAPVRLLDAPALPQEPVFQQAPALRLSFPPLEGAVSYRVWLAADAEFQQMFGAALLSRPEVSFSGLKAGSYVLKVRAIDKYGLEGRDAMVLVGILPDKPVGLQRSGSPAPVKTP
ncbi:MAG: FecR domain-containing protein [Pseudomonadota bacterium]